MKFLYRTEETTIWGSLSWSYN